MSAQPPKPTALTFVGPMHYPATKNLRNACTQMVQSGSPELYILFSSSGGALVEGFALYNFLRALPIKLTMHNIGSVESIANIAFLAADQRYACPNTHFLLHGFDWTFSVQQTLVHERIKEISKSMSADEERFLSVLQSRSGITAGKLQELDFLRKAAIVSATEAKTCGLVQDVKEAKIPAGWQTWNVDY